MVAMDQWVCDGTPPPPSQIPRVKDGTLVPSDQQHTGFPNIPGVRYTALFNRQLFLDYGPNPLRGKIESHPPKQIKKGEYKVLVTKVDADGNDLQAYACAIRVPATTDGILDRGWRSELCGLFGSYSTARQRKKESKPPIHSSIEEREKNHADYINRAHAARGRRR
jgi:hypothetical protein